MLRVQPYPFQEGAIERGLERGSLLIAWEMGLGKTLCALAIMETLLGDDKVDMNVIVVPANLKWQWAQQIAKLTDVETTTKRVKDPDSGTFLDIVIPTEEYCLVVEGTKDKRAALLERAKADRPDYVVLTYETVVGDWATVRRLAPGCIVLDEATAIKSFAAQRTRKIKRFTAPFRYALTGTPIENGKPEEVFSIMQWVDEDVLGRWDLFDRSFVVRNGFGAVVRYKNVPVLHAKLASAMERKTRQDPEVAPYLPDVSDHDLQVSLDPLTRRAYLKIAADLLEELRAAKISGDFDLFAHYHGGSGASDNSAQGKIMARMQALDMLLCHPQLLRLSAARYAASQAAKEAGVVKKTWEGSKYAWEVVSSGVLDGLEASPKLDRLVELVHQLTDADPNSKIIVFSVWRDMADLIAERLSDLGTVSYHGGLNGGQKAAAQARFMTDPDCRVFLSSHAGAYGTDLYVANHLINFDLSWQAGRQDQINARHVRASSSWQTAHVYNLLVTVATDTRRYDSLSFKRTVGRSIVDNSGADEYGRVENGVATLTEALVAELA